MQVWAESFCARQEQSDCYILRKNGKSLELSKLQVESTWCDNSILCICNHMKDQALCQKQKKNMKFTSSSASTGKVKQAIQRFHHHAISTPSVNNEKWSSEWFEHSCMSIKLSEPSHSDIGIPMKVKGGISNYNAIDQVICCSGQNNILWHAVRSQRSL